MIACARGVLSGADLSTYVEREGFSVEATFGARMDVLKMTLHDPLLTLAFPDRAEIVIYDAPAGSAVVDPPTAISPYNTFLNGAGHEVTSGTPANWTPRFFAGYCATPVYSLASSERMVQVQAQDYTYRLRSTVINKAYSAGQSDQTIVKDIFATYRPDFDTTNVASTFASMPAISFPVHSLEQFMQRVVKITRAVYRVDYFKRLFYGAIGQVAAPFNLSDAPTAPVFNGTFEDADTVDKTKPLGWGRSEVGNGTANIFNDVIDGYFERGSKPNEQSVFDLATPSEYTYDNGQSPPSGRGGAMLCTTTRTSVGWNHIAPFGDVSRRGAIPVVQGQAYRLSGWAKSGPGAKAQHIKVSWWQDFNLTTVSAIRTQDQAMGGTDGPLPWTFFSGTYIPPADAHYAYVEMMSGYWDGVTGSNAQHWFNGLSFGPIGPSTMVLDGRGSLALGQLATTTDYGGVWTTQGIPIVAGNVLTISAKYRSNLENQGPFRFRLTFANAGANIDSSGHASAQPSAQAGVNVVDTTATPTDTLQHTLTANVTVPGGYTWVFIECYANPSSTPAAPFIMFVDDVAISGLVGYEGAQYAPDVSSLSDKVWVVGATFLSAQQAYTVPVALVNGSTYQFPLPGASTKGDIVSVTVNAVSKTIGQAPGDGDVTTQSSFKTDCLIQTQPATIAFAVTPPNAATIVVTGKFRYPLIQSYADPALVAAAGGLLFEAVVRDKRITDLILAQNVAKTYLANQGLTLKGLTLTCMTRGLNNVILQPGQLISVTGTRLFTGLGGPTISFIITRTNLVLDTENDLDHPYRMELEMVDHPVSGGY